MAKFRYKRRKGTKSGIAVVLTDVIIFGVALCVFSLFHHVIPMEGGGPIQKLTNVGDVTPTPDNAGDGGQSEVQPPDSSLDPNAANPDGTIAGSTTPEVATTPEPAVGDFSATFPTEDTGANALYSYQTDDLRIAINKVQQNNVTYFIADVYVKRIDLFKTAFARGKYGKSIAESPLITANNNNAILAVTGDYYSGRSKGLVIRNGELYRDTPFADVCVLYENGAMETYPTDQVDNASIIANRAYQAWSFGPELLDNGAEILTFDHELKDKHPRSAIGYYAPGHYCLVVIDGRQSGYSVGMTLAGMSKLFYDLGCKAAYNFDGGQTAQMIFDGQIINQPYKGGRECGDIVYFAKEG